jgi:hypothetical protein
MTTACTYNVGDTVSRQRTIGVPTDGRRIGTITRKYRTQPSTGFQPHWLFDVKWDDSGIEEKGFLEHGLEKV